MLALTPAERAEARSAKLITDLVAQLPDGPALRVRDALSTPTSREFTSQSAASTPRVTAFLTASALGHEAGIKAAYTALSAAERESIHLNAATDVFLDHNVPNVKQRAAIYAMVVSRTIAQYDVMNDFLVVCLDTLTTSFETPPSQPPPRLTELLRRMTLESRLSLYVLNQEARAVFVDPLPEPIRTPVIEILRGDVEP